MDELDASTSNLMLRALVERWRDRAKTSRDTAGEQESPEETGFWEGAGFALDVAARELHALIRHEQEEREKREGKE